MKIVAFVTLASALLGTSVTAQSRRLNGPLPRPGAADVEADYAFSANGAQLLFRADLWVDDAFELFSSPADASGPPERLSRPLAPGGDVVRFVPAGSFVVYLADQDEDEVFELYATRSSSRPHVLAVVHRLSGPLAPGGDVLSFHVTPDGEHAVFLADKLVDGRPEFFRVALDGRTPPVALDPTPSTDPVTSSWLAPDGAHVVHTRRERLGVILPNYIEHLIALPVDGSLAEVEIASSLSSLGYYGSSFPALEFTADGQRVVYIDQVDGEDGAEDIHLFSAPIDGSQAPIVLNQGTSNTSLLFLLSRSLQRVVYSEFDNLYSVALDGTGRVQLDPPTWTPVAPWAFTPDGTSILFQARVGGRFGPTGGLLRSRVDGSQPTSVLVSGSLAIQQILATDRDVAYVQRDGTQFDPFGFRGLWTRALDGTAPAVLLNGPALTRTGCGTAQLAPGDRLLFTNSYSTESISELFVVARDGSLAPRRLSAQLSGGRDVSTFLQAPAGEGVVYRADQIQDGAFELFRTDLGGAGPVALLDLPVGPVVGDVLSFRSAADGRSVVFMADQDTDQEFRLYRVASDGRTGPTRIGNFSFLPSFLYAYALTPAGDRLLEHPTSSSQFLYSVGTEPGASEIELDFGRVLAAPEFTPDSARVVYTNEGGFSPDELVSAALDGSSTINLYRVTDRDVFGHQLTPDGQTVVFLAEVDRNDTSELLRVPVAGGVPALRLNPTFASNRSVTAFRVAPDGLHVVYLADARTNDVFELYVVALDGRRPARRLSAPLVALGDVADFVFAPDGRRVVYRADALANGRAELFSVALLPSTLGGERLRPESEPDVLRLTQLGGTDAVQGDYRVSVDGKQVFFRAVLDGRAELFRVPLLGGQAPERVSLPDHGGVVSFELTADKTRVVYLADRRGDGVHELYATSVFGGPVVALDRLPDFADVTLYRVTPDSRHVVYLCDRRLDGSDELLRVLLDGSEAPGFLNDRLPAGGDVQADFVVLPGGGVVYRADQEVDEVFELYVALPAPP
ncbi:MAG TPA: hypothetical protein VF530_23370 [Planctomycetota bacterium]